MAAIAAVVTIAATTTNDKYQDVFEDKKSAAEENRSVQYV
jgi:hypothetical protein